MAVSLCSRAVDTFLYVESVCVAIFDFICQYGEALCLSITLPEVSTLSQTASLKVNGSVSAVTVSGRSPDDNLKKSAASTGTWNGEVYSEAFSQTASLKVTGSVSVIAVSGISPDDNLKKSAASTGK